MILVPSLAVLSFNPQLTFFLLLGAAIYVGVQTVWLKPRMPLNIVIGGAAGRVAAGYWNAPGAEDVRRLGPLPGRGADHGLRRHGRAVGPVRWGVVPRLSTTA